MNRITIPVKQMLLSLFVALLPLCVSAQSQMETLNYKAPKTRTVEDWGEWTTLGTAITYSGKESLMATFQSWGTGSIEPWEDPITIDQRTSKSDPTKHQLCLKGIFNAKDIILDFDSSTASVTAEKQSTGYSTDKSKLADAGVSEPYEEFQFSCKGTYRPATGYIMLKNVFIYVCETSGFRRDMILQIEGVTPPNFGGSWDRKYVARNETKATYTLTFEAPIVKYRKVVLAPGKFLSSNIDELYVANPETDINYEESDQLTFDITCTEIGVYSICLVPIGADGTAVMECFITSVVSYAEPEYESYTWDYIGESTVSEYAGSVLIPSDDKWIEVDGNWVYKYPYMATSEGVKTYRRTDNPNIIGLLNLYGENHVYSSKYRYVDPSTDWWIYIDVTNPDDVKIFKTPVGIIVEGGGYASFIWKQEPSSAATYSEGVITFPLYSLAIWDYMANQSGGGDFDMKIILPAEDNSETAVGQIELGTSGISGQNSMIYDLYGRRINGAANLKSGVYVVNGQKVYIP